jgi:tetratricopeptide (TPR) repeat protein
MKKYFKLTLLISDLTNQAIESFKVEDFAKSQKSFEQILAIEGTKVYKSDDPNAIDTAIVFNAGLAAFEAKNYDKAIEHYKNAAKYKYNGARTYQLISNSYIQKKDTVLALKALEDGLKEFPGNGGILIDVINIYINGNKVDEALKYLDIAIEKDPKNPSYHFAKGAMYDKMQNTTAAIECYLKAIEYKEDYFDALFNLGAIYYNLGVKQVDVANAVPSNQAEKYEAEKEKADVEFRKALPYMEKASVINPTDKFTLESLKTLYYRLKMMDKHAEIVEKLKSL